MDNPAFINVTTLPAVVASAIATGQQVTIYDQSGVANRAAIEDVVSAAQGLNGCICVKTQVTDLSTAEILAMATPIACTEVPSASQYIDVISAVIEYTNGGTDFVGGGNLLISNSAGPQIYFDGVLQEPASRYVKGIPVIPASTDSNIALGEAMQLLTLVNPTLGDGTARVRVTYTVQDQ